nr:glycosyl hydrolase family 65 protein [Arthrobacter sp. SF27]
MGGLQIEGGVLQLAPRLPARLGRIAFRFQWRGHRLRVETTAEGTVVRLLDGHPTTTGLETEIGLSIDGKDYTVTPGRPAVAPLCSPDPLLPTPTQPVGRAPDGM